MNRRPKLRINLKGPEGNIFMVQGMAGQLISTAQYEQLSEYIRDCKTYEEALNLINQYVEIKDESGLYVAPRAAAGILEEPIWN
jgi:hypothetical protein